MAFDSIGPTDLEGAPSSDPTRKTLPPPRCARYRKCSPSGRKDGHRCQRSPPSSVVTVVGFPPFAGTFISDPGVAPPKTITSSPLQVAPPSPSSPSGASQTSKGTPPRTVTVLSFPP